MDDTGTVTLTLSGYLHVEQASSMRTATLTMINSTCANPKKLWLEGMGSVTWPDDRQLAQLRAASKMCEEKVPVVPKGTSATVTVTLEPYAAAMLTIA